MVFFVIITLVFLVICLYGIFMPKYMAKQGRIVDARVVYCESKDVQIGDQGGTYYEVTVDFYGMHGETIQKKFKSQKPYTEGEVLRSRYVDKTGRFMKDADKDAKNNGGLWVAVGFLVLVLLLLIGSTRIQKEGLELSNEIVAGFGYFISVLFMVVGVGGLIKQIRLKKNAPMVVDSVTGKRNGKEDEKASGMLYLVFGIMGLAVFLVLLAGSAGLLQNVVTSPVTDKGITENTESTGWNESDMDQMPDTSKLMVYIMYPEGEEKISYSIEISESGKGSMILFPTVSVSGKGIDQYIDFKLPISEVARIGAWIEEADVKNLNLENVDNGTMAITVYVTEGEEQYDGRGTLDMPPYDKLYELLSELVPANVWDELQKREISYYR